MAPTGETSAFNEGKTIPVAGIPDLDTGSSTKVVKAVNRSLSLNFAAILRQAKCVSQGRENEDAIEVKVNSEEQEDEDDGSQFSLYAEHEDISCLCGVNVLSKVPQLDLTNCGSIRSLPKPWKSSGKGKKRKKTKSGNKKKIHKRQKVDVSSDVSMSEPHRHLTSHIYNKPMKTAGGGSHKTSTKAGCVPAQQPAAPVANGGMFCLCVHGQRGGGGGGGDDGDGRPPKKPPEEVKCGLNGAKRKAKKKKTKTNKEVSSESTLPDSSGEDDRQPEVNNATVTSSMVVDKQNERSEDRRDVDMVSEVVQQNNDPQMQHEQPRPCQAEEVVITQKLLVLLNGRINHHTFCRNKTSCKQCGKVKTIMAHYKETCVCRDCQLWSRALQYHKPICRYENCCVCGNASERKQAYAAAKPRVHAEQSSFPTCGESLDERVVWKDPDVPAEVRYFKENKDYVIAENGFVGKGGHGSVHDVEIPDSVKKKCFSSTSRDFVMKKVHDVSKEEMYVFEEVWKHPNFVQTHMVIEKMKPDKHYLVLMGKCEMSLKDYINQLLRQNKRMNIYEAMFYWTQVFEAIKHLHFRRIGVVHKDIKAGNVLLTIADNLVRVRLADFDTAKQLHDEYTMPGLPPKGTRGLISLEVLRQESHGRPSDVWNMGMFLFQLLFPIEFSNLQRDLQPSQDAKVFVPRYESLVQNFLAKAIPELKKTDQDLGDLIELCLSEEPSERPTTIKVLKDPAVRKYVSRKINMDEIIGKICPNGKQ